MRRPSGGDDERIAVPTSHARTRGAAATAMPAPRWRHARATNARRGRPLERRGGVGRARARRLAGSGIAAGPANARPGGGIGDDDGEDATVVAGTRPRPQPRKWRRDPASRRRGSSACRIRRRGRGGSRGATSHSASADALVWPLASASDTVSRQLRGEVSGRPRSSDSEGTAYQCRRRLRRSGFARSCSAAPHEGGSPRADWHTTIRRASHASVSRPPPRAIRVGRRECPRQRPAPHPSLGTQDSASRLSVSWLFSPADLSVATLRRAYSVDAQLTAGSTRCARADALDAVRAARDVTLVPRRRSAAGRDRVEMWLATELRPDGEIRSSRKSDFAIVSEKPSCPDDRTRARAARNAATRSEGPRVHLTETRGTAIGARRHQVNGRAAQRLNDG